MLFLFLDHIDPDIIFQAFNFADLSRKDLFDNIADGDQSNHILTGDHGQVAEMFGCHQIHAFFDGMLGVT
jgi:hypothetical protein